MGIRKRLKQYLFFLTISLSHNQFIHADGMPSEDRAASSFALNNILVGFSDTYFRYHETNTTYPAFNVTHLKYFNLEKGWIPGLTFEGQKTFNHFYLDVQSSFEKANVQFIRGDYFRNGTEIIVAPGVNTYTSATLYNASIAAGYLFTWNDFIVIPGGRFGYHFWQRYLGPQIGSADRSNEVYQNYFLAGELQVVYSFTSKLNTKLRLDLGSTIKPNMNWDIAYFSDSPFASYAQTFRLQPRMYSQADLNINYLVKDKYIIELGMSYTGFRYGISPIYHNAIVNRSALEPNSKTSYTRLYFSVGYFLD